MEILKLKSYTVNLMKIIPLLFILMLVASYAHGQTITATPNISTGCDGQVVEYTLVYNGSGEIASMDWDKEPSSSCTISPSPNPQSRIVTWHSTGTVEITWGERISGVVYERHSEIDFTVLNTAGTISGPNTVCYEGSGSFTHSGSPSGTVTWQRCVSGCSTTTDDGWSTNTGDNVFSDLTVTTSFRVKLTSATCGVKYSNIKTVTVEPDMSGASVTISNPFPLCGNSVLLNGLTFTSSISHTGGSPTYAWYRSSRGTSPTDDNESTDPSQYKPHYTLQDGEVIYCKVSYSYNCTVNNPAESNHVTVSLTQPEVPSVMIDGFPGADHTFCQGESVTFTASSAWTITGYQWGIGGSGTLDTSPTFTVVAGEDFFEGDLIKLTANVSGSCLATTTASDNTSGLNITIIPAPVVQATAETGPNGCPGGVSDFSFTLSNPYEYSSHQWIILTANAGNISSEGEATWESSGFTGEATVKITATVCNNIEREDEVIVTIRPRPSVPSDANLEYCDFEPISLSVPDWTNRLNWYDQGNNFLSTGYDYVIPCKKSGNYTYLAEYISGYGCISATRFPINVSVTSACDDKLNTVETISYNENQTVVANQKSYFGYDGRSLQTQVKNLTRNEVLTSQGIRDVYDREVINTLSAPVDQTSFQYKHWFVQNQSGGLYNYLDAGQPLATSQGTAGGYYGSGNEFEEHVPITGYPFSTIEYYNDGTGEIKYSAGPGEVHRLGEGREALSGTFPVVSELDDYLSKRSLALPGIGQDGSLENEGVQNVVRDQNGKYGISITDKSGKAIMTARKGTRDNFSLRVDNTITVNSDEDSPDYRPMGYFYLLDAQPVPVETEGADYKIEDIVHDREFNISTDADAEGNWPAGFYRIVITTGAVTVRYSNFYLDVAYQFYDDTGRLMTSISPNGQSKLPALYGQFFAGKDWTFKPLQVFENVGGLSVTLSLQTNPDQSKIAYSKFQMPAGTYEVTGEWAKNVTSGSGTCKVTYYLLDKDLNVLDSESEDLSSTTNEITLFLTSTEEIFYIGVSAATTSGSGSVDIEGNIKTGRNIDFAQVDKTDYTYNFKGWLLRMTEPDAGMTEYVYRNDGKIRFSQNAEQRNTDRYSFTHYDAAGRPVESGEYTGTDVPFVPMDDAGFNASPMKGELEKKFNEISWDDEVKKDWVRTYYDYPDDDLEELNLPEAYAQNFVRGAISKTENANILTWYSYDELGRVTWMARKPKKLHQLFVVKYTYDFLGNVLMAANLSYSETGTLLSQFYHHYEYDDDQRLSKASTSLEETGSKKLRATYEYYLHGPLKRIELGDELQGIDFVYNIQGWLTQINHPDPAQDPHGDGNDVFGMVIDYYESDMTNLLTSSVGSPHDPARRHGLPANHWAALTDQHQPLIRFSPEQPASDNAFSLKTYSAENPRYKQMVNANKNK